MHTRTAALTAALLLAPLAAKAQTFTGPEVPAGYFSTVFRTWTLAGCSYDGLTCFTGLAALGQRAGTTGPLGYEFLGAVQNTVLNPRYSVFIMTRFFGQGDIAGSPIGYEFRNQAGGTNGVGPWGVATLPGGFFPELYVGGASPNAFNISTFAAEFDYRTNEPGGAGPNVTEAFLTITPTPEPATVALLGAGVLAVAGWGSRRRRGRGATG